MTDRYAELKARMARYEKTQDDLTFAFAQRDAALAIYETALSDAAAARRSLDEMLRETPLVADCAPMTMPQMAAALDRMAEAVAPPRSSAHASFVKIGDDDDDAQPAAVPAPPPAPKPRRQRKAKAAPEQNGAVAPAPATMRSCRVCGVGWQDQGKWADRDLCQSCHGFEPLGAFELGREWGASTDDVRLTLAAHEDGRAIGRTGRLGNWASCGEDETFAPPASAVLDAVGPLVGARLASVKVDEAHDGTLVLRFMPEAVKAVDDSHVVVTCDEKGWCYPPEPAHCFAISELGAYLKARSKARKTTTLVPPHATGAEQIRCVVIDSGATGVVILPAPEVEAKDDAPLFATDKEGATLFPLEQFVVTPTAASEGR